jgi:hypothetical protein
MIFNLGAAKAYVGGVLMAAAEAASAGNGVAGLLIKGVEATLSFDIPPSIEGLIATGVGFIIGWLAVYFVPNKPQPKV